MKVDEVPVGSLHPAVRASIYQKLTPQAIMHQILPLSRSAEHSRNGTAQLAHERERSNSPGFRSLPTTAKPGDSAAKHKRQDSLNSTNPVGYTPNMEAQHIMNKDGSMTPMKLPNSLTPEDFTRAVAAATVSALRQHAHAAGKKAGPMNQMEAAGEEEEHGGHEGPSWSRAVSAAVLLVCTVLYAAIAG
jgi:Ca2+:H+ antiporter